MISYMWFWFAIGSALTSAISVILNKKALKNIDTSLVSWSLFAFSIPFLIYPAFKDGWPQVNNMFWVATIASIISFAYAKTLALKSLKGNLMSEVVPLAFFAVLFQYVLGLIFFSEVLKLTSIFGLVLIILGGYLLKVEEAKEGIFKPFKLLFTNKGAVMYLTAMAIMPFTSVFDKTGLMNMKNVNQSFLLLWENVATTLLIGFYITRKNRNWIKEVKNNFFTLFLSGVVYATLSLFYLYGITGGSLALVSGVKKLEVFFILVIGWFLFKDRPKRGVWIGSFIMLLGVILIKVG